MPSRRRVTNIRRALRGASGFLSKEPSAIADLAVWFRADLGVTTSGSAVTDWADQSGNGHDLTQGTAAERPTFNATDSNFAGHPTITFDGSDDELTFSSVPSLTVSAELFQVIKRQTVPPVAQAAGAWNLNTSDSAGHYPFTDSNIYDNTMTNARKSAGAAPAALTSAHLYNCRSASGSWILEINGVTQLSTGTNTFQAWNGVNPAIGTSNHSTRYFEGEYAEFFAFDRVLDTSERKSLKLYVANRYAIPIA